MAYTAGVRRVPEDEAKIQGAKSLIAELTAQSVQVVIAAQALAELHFVLVRRTGLGAGIASTRVSQYTELAIVIPTTDQLLSTAFDLVAEHHLQTYDAIILAASAQAGCDTLYSEDMQAGFVWNGVEIINPFA